MTDFETKYTNMTPPEEPVAEETVPVELVVESVAEDVEPAVEEAKEPEQAEEERKRKSGIFRLKEQRDAARKELEDLKASMVNPPMPSATPSAGKPNISQFDSIEDYENARDIWYEQATERKVQERFEQERQKEEYNRMAKSWEQAEDAVRAEHDDYDVVVDNTMVQRGLLNPNAGHVIIKSPNGPQVFYWLATHEEDARRIASMDPIEAAVEYKLLERGMNKKPTVEAPAPAKPISKAPAPIAAVKGGGGTSTHNVTSKYREL